MDRLGLGPHLMLAYARMLLGRKSGGGADTQAVTAGTRGNPVLQTRRIGYINAAAGLGAALGSIADGTSDLYAGATILALYWDEDGGSPNDSFNFIVSGIQLNSGWTQMVVNGGAPLLRANASFSNVSDTQWSWPSTGSLFPAGVCNVVFS